MERAETPPSRWYYGPEYYEKDIDLVLERSWQLADVRPVQPGTYRTGQLGRVEYLLTCDAAGTLRAFHNVCRHHAAVVAQGEGECSADCRFSCPYHGWTYNIQGRLVQATKLKGIQDFSAKQNGLVPIGVEQWGPFLFLNPSHPSKPESSQTLQQYIGAEAVLELEAAGVADHTLKHIKTHTYRGIRCNWKVFCDNYLDGGYHVPVAHADLAGGLSLDGYTSRCYSNCSIQSCDPAKDDRLGKRRVAYAFIFPNIMINRYGPWMDVNVVYPTSPNTCDVRFDWWLEDSHVGDKAFVEESLHASDKVQREDIMLCQSVQRGLQSPGYDVGRYAPAVEVPMFHFHQLLHARYTAQDAH